MDFQVAMQGETLRKGPWHEKEDERLITYVALLGERNWDALARAAGLKRRGKSCRLRWLNYLHPNLKRSRITEEEERIIIQLHQQWGNKWSRIARSLPGRTDNEIKNYWRSHLSKKIQAQEHANFQCTINNAKQELHYQNVDSKAWESTVEHNTIGFCSDHHALSDFSYLNSPYEARLLDWMSELPSDRSETKSNTDYNGVDSSLCYPDSNTEGSHVRISDSFVSLWDMN